MAGATVAACSAARVCNAQRSLQPARGAFRALALRRSAAAAPQRRRQQQQQRAVQVQAFVREWTDPEFAAAVIAAFPDQAIADAEQARALIEKGGYTYLDVRPALELDEAGKAKGCVNVPIVNSKWVYNAEERKKSVVKAPNDAFLAQVQKRFPKLDTPLVIGCSDGTTYSIDALVALDEAGYTNLVGLKGGFYAWFRVFDNKGARRRYAEYAEQNTHDGDTCGIHASGAGFEKMDAIEAWAPPKF